MSDIKQIHPAQWNFDEDLEGSFNEDKAQMGIDREDPVPESPNA